MQTTCEQFDYEAKAIAEPIVSMSPFLPVNTGTAPFETVAEIQSAKFCTIPLKFVLLFHM